MTQIPNITEANFDDLVLRSPLPVLVDFTAQWCPPCRAIEPILESIATQHTGVRVVQVDADACAALAARYRVRALPTVISFSGGQEHNRHSGATSKAVLTGLLPEGSAV